MSLYHIVEELTVNGVRRLRRGEIIPMQLDVGLEDLDENWVWVALRDGRIVAAIVAAPCHSMVFLVRLVCIPGNGYKLPGLLRAFIRDSKERGFKGYLTYLDESRAEEKKILSILRRSGTVYEHPNPQHLIGGKLSDLEKW